MDFEEMFDGFDEPRSNYSKLPHQFINVLPDIKTLGEMKVILYVLRHTWGFGDDEKKITMDEFMYGRKRKNGERYDSGTGLSEPTLRAGIQQAVEDGFLDVETDSHDKARIKKIYSLRERNLPPEGKELTPNPKETLPRTEKETLDRNNREDGDVQTTSPDPTSDELFNAMKSQSDGMAKLEVLDTAVADPQATKTRYIKTVGSWFGDVLSHQYPSSTDKSAAGQCFELHYPMDKLLEFCRFKDGKYVANGKEPNAYWIKNDFDEWRTNGYPPLEKVNRVSSSGRDLSQ